MNWLEKWFVRLCSKVRVIWYVFTDIRNILNGSMKSYVGNGLRVSGKEAKGGVEVKGKK